MNDQMLAKYRKVIARLLEIAGDEFSNHVCDDFDLEGVLPNRDDRQELVKQIAKRDDPERYSPDANYDTMSSAELMLFFASVLDE